MVLLRAQHQNRGANGMAQMAIQRTTVSKTETGFSVEVVLASEADLETATEFVRLRLPVAIPEDIPIRHRSPRFPRLQQAVLANAYKAIKDEIDHLTAAMHGIPD